MRKKLMFAIIALALFMFLKSTTRAEDLSSDNYRIQLPNINMTSGRKTSPGYTLTDTVGQTAPGEYQSTGYIVKAGFQYLHSIIPFSFEISDISVDFGTLTPETPSTQTITLTVSSGGAGGYQVTAYENHPLKKQETGETIPDTSCDGGANTCTETSAKPWTQSTAYGFGYNMQGNDIPSDFLDSTYFRPFPDASQSENPAIVMSSSNVGAGRQATMTLKVNISSTQAAGRYQNIINFVATPSY